MSGIILFVVEKFKVSLYSETFFFLHLHERLVFTEFSGGLSNNVNQLKNF